jgi:anti-anti-sigma regulatory factor
VLCVDLADVEFGDTALLSFLVRVINGTPAGTPVALCRLSRIIRRLLHLSFLDTIVAVRDDLPFDAVAPHLDAAVHGRRHVRMCPRTRRLAGIGVPR